jgi:hypothetical protein
MPKIVVRIRQTHDLQYTIYRSDARPYESSGGNASRLPKDIISARHGTPSAAAVS